MSERESIPNGQMHRGVIHEIIPHYGQGQDSRGRPYVWKMYHVEVSYFEDDVRITASKRWLQTIGEAQAIVRKYRERWER